MHLYFFIRGKFEQIELFKSHAQSFYWKFRRFNKKTKKQEIKLVQGSLRPSIFGAYEYVFPKEALAEVCCIFGIFKNEQYGFGKFGLLARHAALRKMFGCEKIPNDILEKAKKLPSSFTTEEYERGSSNCVIPGVSLHLIGIKKDNYGEMGDFEQELL